MLRMKCALLYKLLKIRTKYNIKFIKLRTELKREIYYATNVIPT